jgi:hypothetical protein
VLTGDVENAYPLVVSREGILFIPTMGQGEYVAGQPMDSPFALTALRPLR